MSRKLSVQAALDLLFGRDNRVGSHIIYCWGTYWVSAEWITSITGLHPLELMENQTSMLLHENWKNGAGLVYFFGDAETLRTAVMDTLGEPDDIEALKRTFFLVTWANRTLISFDTYKTLADETVDQIWNSSGAYVLNIPHGPAYNVVSMKIRDLLSANMHYEPIYRQESTTLFMKLSQVLGHLGLQARDLAQFLPYQFCLIDGNKSPATYGRMKLSDYRSKNAASNVWIDFDIVAPLLLRAFASAYRRIQFFLEWGYLDSHFAFGQEFERFVTCALIRRLSSGGRIRLENNGSHRVVDVAPFALWEPATHGPQHLIMVNTDMLAPNDNLKDVASDVVCVDNSGGRYFFVYKGAAA